MLRKYANGQVIIQLIFSLREQNKISTGKKNRIIHFGVQMLQRPFSGYIK